MDKKTFENLRRQSRAANRGFEVRHNGERYYVFRHNVSRLGPDGTFNRVRGADIAMALAHAAHARMNLKLPRACYGLIGVARDRRLGGQS